MKIRKRVLAGVVLALSFSASLFSQQGSTSKTRPPAGSSIPRAVVADATPVADRSYAPTSVELAIPSHDSVMNGVLYLAAGAGKHPTAVLLHGFPGYETNQDIAQSLRRSGWNVLIFHYRGSWGSEGAFSFGNALEDVDVAIEFLRSPENTQKYRVDPSNLVLVGHSMGGFLAVQAAARHPRAEVRAVVTIAAWNIGAEAATWNGDKEQIVQQGLRSEMPPLHGTSAEALVAEAKAHAAEWSLAGLAPKLKGRPMLMIIGTYDHGVDRKINHDPVEAALRKAGAKELSVKALPSDHSFGDHRIALQAIIVRWMEMFLPDAAK